MFDDIDGNRGLGLDSSNGQGGNDGQNDSRAGNYGNGGITGNLRNYNDDSDLWASRLVRRHVLVLLCITVTVATTKRRQ